MFAVLTLAQVMIAGHSLWPKSPCSNAAQEAISRVADTQCWNMTGANGCQEQAEGDTRVACTEAGSLDYENHEIVLVLNYEPGRRNHLPICTGPNSS